MSTGTRTAYDIVAEVPDPEIPFIDIAGLGILRDVETSDSGRVTVTITPTYSGCPAMRAIEEDIRERLAAAGYHDVEVDTRLSPAWTTDWMTDEARHGLERAGIAPPAPTALGDRATLLCPRCASKETRVVSVFGTTACKALMACSACGEPFDHFKSL